MYHSVIQSSSSVISMGMLGLPIRWQDGFLEAERDVFFYKYIQAQTRECEKAFFDLISVRLEARDLKVHAPEAA